MLALRGVALLALCGVSEATDTQHAANPIRRVVTMIQNIQQKVAAEGAKEKELFDKFMCYCQTGSQNLGAAIGQADEKIPMVEGQLNSAIAKKAQLEGEVAQHQADRTDAKKAIATATALREKQAATYAADSSKFNSDITAMEKAIKAIQDGMAGSFLQSSSGQQVRSLVIDTDISPADRDQVMSFLAQKEGNPTASLGILNQMLDTMKADLAELTKSEKASIADFDALVAAKEKQVETNTASIEAKIERVGNLGVDISTMKEDLSDTQETLLEDKKFLADLDTTCATKQKEWDVRSKTRSEELLALSDTIKILNDDDALELFKKALPAVQLFQTKVTATEVKKQALQALKNSHNNPKIDLIALALRGKSVSFAKVISMIDKMVVLLEEEQSADDNKKEVCEMQLDKAEDDLKTTETNIADLETSISELKDKIASLADEIADLVKGIKDLDSQVEDASYTRKEEHEDFVALMAQDAAAKEIISFAKNRLQKFYNPSMYKAAPKRELSMEEKMGFGFIQLHKSKALEAPPPPPATWDAYNRKGEESNGVMQMMDMIVADLDKEMQEAQVNEDEAQKEYEQFMQDSGDKRIADSKSMQNKQGAKANAESALQKDKKEHMNKVTEAMAIVDVINSLHKECDWLLQNFETRKEARAGEVDSLKKAKAVLSGADYSLLAVQKRKFLRHK